MQQRSKFMQRTSALALAAVLALGTGVQAAGPDASTADDRREDLTVFYETLKDSHPDLFANTPEETFLARMAELTDQLGTASDVEFLFGLQSLSALAGDSHTSVQVADSVVGQLNAYPMVLSWRDGHWYLTTVPAEERDLLGAEVTAIGGRSMAEVVEAFGRVLSADNPVKLRRQYRQVCNVADYYAYLGLAEAGEPLDLTLADGKTVSIAPMPYRSLGEAEIVQLGAEVPQPATAHQKRNYLRASAERTGLLHPVQRLPGGPGAAHGGLCRPGAGGPGGRRVPPRSRGPAEQRRRVRRRDLAPAVHPAAGDG